MRARDHTDRMLAWWQAVGVDRIDLAVRRHRLHEFRNPYDPGNLWLWQRAVPLSDLRRLLPWARAENARRSEIYARPSRGSSWPVVFLDDVDRTTALGLTRRHPALCAHTSLAGGCQLWLRCERLLDEEERYRCQKNLVVLHGADPGSVSGEHLGRLAGHRNWKRQGTWVNVLAATLDGPPLLAPPAPPTSASQSSLSLQAQPRYRRQAQAGGDPSESAREWGWVLGALQSGLDPETVYVRLLARSQDRRGADVERYSRRTIEKALSELAERQSRDNPP